MSDDPSQKKKTILIVVAAAVAIVLVGALLRSLFSSAPTSRQEFGLTALSMAADNGDTWVLDLAKGQSVSGLKNRNTKPGPPLLVKTDVQAQGRELSIGLLVEGQAGESYQPGALKNGVRVPPPTFKVIDESGKVLAASQFHYG
jgi:hypothetical protein